MKDKNHQKQELNSLLNEEHILCKEIIKLSPDGVIIVDVLTKKVIYVNPVVSDLFGYSEAELLEMQVGDSSQEEDKSEHIEFFNKVANCEDTYNDEIALLKKNKELIYIDIKASVGEINGRKIVFSFFRDVTSRHNEQELLKEREEQFRVMADNVPIPVAISKLPDGEIIYANKLLGTAYGYNSSDEMIGLSFRSFYSDQQDIENIISILKDKGEVRNYQSQRVRKDGKKFWSLLSLNKVTYMGEDAICGGFIDITEKIKTEQKLLDIEKKFYEALEYSRDIIYRSNLATGTYDYLSSSVKEITGYTPEEVIEMGFEGVFDLAHPDDKKKFKMSTEELRKEAKAGSDNIEYRLKINDQYRWFSDNHTVVLNENDDPIYIIGSVRDITDKIENEQILLDTERKFNEALEYSRDIIYRGNFKSNTYDYLSSSIKEITGLTSEEVIEKGFECIYERIHPDDRLKLKMSLFELRKEVKIGSDSIEYRFMLNGKYRWLSDSYTVIANEDGDPAYIIGSVRDITKEKEIITALEESEEKYRSLYSNIPLVVFRSTPKGELLAVNKPAVEMFDQNTENDLKQMSVLDFYANPDDRTKLLKELKANGEVSNFITEVKSCYGKRSWVSLSINAIYDSSGEIKYLDGIAEDVTKRKLTEDALRQSEEKYRSLVQNVNAVISLINYDGEFLFVNKTAAETFNRKPKDFVNKTMWDLFKQEKADSQIQSVRSVIDSKKEIRIEEQTVINNITYWYDNYILPVKDFENKKTVAMLISHDITHIKEAEKKLQEVNSELDEERQNLLKKNIALNEVLKQFEGEREIISKQIHENMELTVRPVLNSLEKKLKQGELKQFEHLRNCLDELTSPFVSKLQNEFASLTSGEVEICRMIKNGLQTKEIAEARKVSVRTIEKFRQIIRKKLKLTNRKVNLTNYLRNM